LLHLKRAYIGEILGLGRHLRKHYPAIKIIGVLPDGAVIEQEAGAHFRRVSSKDSIDVCWLLTRYVRIGK
jgi:cysteine synthase